MLQGKEFTAMVDDISSRVARNVNIGGETVTKAGFEDVKVEITIKVSARNGKNKGRCSLTRKAEFSEFDYCMPGSGSGVTGSVIPSKKSHPGNASLPLSNFSPVTSQNPTDGSSTPASKGYPYSSGGAPGAGKGW